MPLVSIGIPFFNNADTLVTMIRSVFAQTFQDWELLLLDDGSSDGSLAIGRAVSDPRVRVIADGRNQGLTVRLNQLTRESRGDYIVRMDGDDVMVPDRIERQIAVLESQPDVDVVVSPSYLIDKSGSLYGVDSRASLAMSAGMYLRARNVWFAHPTMTARTSWMRANPYDESFRLGQEKELFCRTYDRSTFCKLDDPVLFYREAGTVRLPSYRAQRRTDRRVLRAYGPRLIGWRKSIALACVSVAKEGIYVAAHKVGLHQRLDAWLARQRAASFPLEERQQAMLVLETVQRTRVPGLDDDA